MLLKSKRNLVIRLLFVSSLTFLLFFYLARPYRVGSSDEDFTTLYLNRLVYKIKEPEISDQVMIQTDSERAFIVGEIAGQPGDKIQSVMGVLYINELPYPNGFPDLRGRMYNDTLKDSEYFVLSLGPKQSVLGIVSKKNIAGKLWAIDI